MLLAWEAAQDVAALLLAERKDQMGMNDVFVIFIFAGVVHEFLTAEDIKESLRSILLFAVMMRTYMKKRRLVSYLSLVQ